jgi:hypothetical protein
MHSATTLSFVLAVLAQTASAAPSQIAYNGQCLTVSYDLAYACRARGLRINVCLDVRSLTPTPGLQLP